MLTADDLNTQEPSSSTSVNRKMSFVARVDSDWAFRPPAEQLYEHIDEFFPKHNLDAPVLESSTVPESPSSEAASPSAEANDGSVIAPLRTGSPAQIPRTTRHKKSIRVVAQDRKRQLEKAEQAGQAPAGAPAAIDKQTGLARRRSTRFGAVKCWR